jgi:glycosyltransferase involved in cell wall biosynthesis
MVSVPGESVSLCTTVYNTEETIEAFLAPLVPTPYEIVVVDGGSSDATPDRLRAHQERLRLHFSSRHLSRGRGRDLAMEIASGEILVQLDGDVIYRNIQHYVDRYRREFRGRLVDFGAAGRSLRIPHLLIGDRRAFAAVGGYRDTFAYEDIGLTRRARAAGLLTSLPIDAGDATKLSLRGFSRDGHDAREYERSLYLQLGREIRNLLAKIPLVGLREAVVRPWTTALLEHVRGSSHETSPTER